MLLIDITPKSNQEKDSRFQVSTFQNTQAHSMVMVRLKYNFWL